jgi:hypothetical protein
VVTTPLPLALEVQRLPQPVHASAEVWDAHELVDGSSAMQDSSDVAGLETKAAACLAQADCRSYRV